MLEQLVDSNIQLARTKMVMATHGDSFNEKGEIIRRSTQVDFEIEDKIIKSKNEIFDLDEKLSNQIKNSLFKYLQRNSNNCTQPMLTHFKIPAFDKDLLYTIQFENGYLSEVTTMPDLIVTYPASFIMMLLSNMISFRELHYTYRFKAQIYNNKSGQTSVHRWA